MSYYIPLHVHSVYSFLDGLNTLSDLINWAKAHNITTIGISDHNITSIVNFWAECIKAGIKPILGTEMYINHNPTLKEKGNRKSYHMCIWCKNLDGYRELCAIYSEAAIEYFYYKPRTSLDAIKKHVKGVNLIASSACLGGYIPKLIVEGKMDEAEEWVYKHKEIFGDGNFFLELMPIEIPDQKIVNLGLVELAKRTNTPTIITTDAHYPKQEDAEIQKILMKIQTEKADGTGGLEFETSLCWLMSYDEILHYMSINHPGISKDVVAESLANTVKISEMCDDYAIVSDTLQVPVFELPEGVTAEEVLQKKCYERLPELYGDSEEAKKRLDYELGVICKSKYASYFLIVEDVVKYARDNGLKVGPGRGSAAGCLVSYLLGIVKIDPVRWGLHFERFLNPERVKPPDIDVDFGAADRKKVLYYIQSKYGKDKVAQILTYNKLRVKSALKDVNRVLEKDGHGVPYDEINRITKPIGNLESFDEAMANHPEMKTLQKKHPKMFEIVKRITRMPRNPGKHPAGVIITPEPLDRYAAISLDGKSDKKAEDYDEIPVLQTDMDGVTKLNLLKLDCLIIGLELLDDTMNEVYKNWGIKITQKDLDEVDLNDSGVYKLLRRGKTGKIFQLGSNGMKKLLQKIKPDKFEDLIAVLALYRPGPLQAGMDVDYINGKNAPDRIKYYHPAVKSALEPTYGIILYQEQIMEVVSIFSGIPFGSADLFRRHMEGKDTDNDKYRKDRKEWHDRFVDGALKQGYDKSFAEKTFEWIISVSGYLFNKSHSTSYAVNAFQMAYLKHYFFVEFMTAILRIEAQNKKIKKYKDRDGNIKEIHNIDIYVQECYDEGYPVVSVDINKSDVTFSCNDVNVIRVGFRDVKGVGDAAAQAIIDNSHDIPGGMSGCKYKDMVEVFYYNRASMGVVKRVIEPLAYAGAFDSITNNNRKSVLEFLEAYNKLDKILKKAPELDMYYQFFSDYFKSVKNVDYNNGMLKVKDFDSKEKTELEKDVLGFNYNYQIKGKKRHKPVVNIGSNKKDNIKVVSEVKIDKKGKVKDNNMEENEVEVIKCVALSDDAQMYELLVSVDGYPDPQPIKLRKDNVKRFKDLLIPGKKLIYKKERDANGKLKKMFFDANDFNRVSNKDDKNMIEENKISEKVEKSVENNYNVSEVSVVKLCMTLMESRVPYGIMVSLIDDFEKDTKSSIASICEKFYVDKYMTDSVYERFLIMCRELDGKINFRDFVKIFNGLKRDSRFMEVMKYSPYNDAKIDDLGGLDKILKIRKILYKKLSGVINDISYEIERDASFDDIGNLYSEMIKIENKLGKVESTIYKLEKGSI